MPLARIFTLLPERATALSLQLKKQGYTIEILRPGQTGAEAADLEIDLEICPQTDAFHRAIELASKLKADIAVAPGSIRFAPEPLVVPVDPEPLAPTPAVIQAPAEPIAPIVPAAPSIAEVIETPRPAAPPPQAMPPREPAHQQTFASRPASPDFGMRLSESWQQVRPSLEKAAAAVQEWCIRAVAASKTTFSQVRESSRRSFTDLRESAYSGSLSARQWLRTARERARLRAAESRARRQEQLVESEQRRARAEREAADLRVAREAAAARLLQIRLEAGGQIRDEAEASHPASAGVEPVARQSAAEDAFDRPRASRQIKIRRTYSSQLEAILTGVAAVSALFVIGLVVASFQPRTALSHGLDPSYKGATVQGGGVTLKPSAKAKTMAPRPSPAVKTSAAQTKQVQSKPSPRPSTQNQNDVTVDNGQDVSVRHFAAPRKPPMQSARQGGGMKRYSDFDN